MATKFELNSVTPAAPSGKVNIIWQYDSSGNVSGYVTPGGGASAPGIPLKVNGVQIGNASSGGEDVPFATDSEKYSNATASAAADAIAALLNNGWLRIYSGTQPANANTAITSQVLLAELRFGNPAFAAAINGVAAANAMTSDASANAAGTATWFRAYKSDGTTAVFDGSVAVSGADLNLSETNITAGAGVSVTSFTITQQV